MFQRKLVVERFFFGARTVKAAPDQKWSRKRVLARKWSGDRCGRCRLGKHIRKRNQLNGYPFLFPTTARILAKAAANIQLLPRERRAQQITYGRELLIFQTKPPGKTPRNKTIAANSVMEARCKKSVGKTGMLSAVLSTKITFSTIR